MCDIIFN
jgi:hypothetical protein